MGRKLTAPALVKKDFRSTGKAYEIVCVQCGCTYYPNQHNSIYCSRQCNNNAASERKRKAKGISMPKLAQVPTAFVKKDYPIITNRKILSTKQKKDWRGIKNTYEAKCSQCGVKYYPNHKSSVFCSKQCCNDARVTQKLYEGGITANPAKLSTAKLKVIFLLTSMTKKAISSLSKFHSWLLNQSATNRI